MANEVMLECEIKNDLTIVENVEAVVADTMNRANKAIEGLGISLVEVDGEIVARGVEDSKEHKALCTNINKTVAFIKDQRIDFEKRLYELPAVKRVVEAFSGAEKKLAAMREPIWGKYNQLHDAATAVPEEQMEIKVTFTGVTASVLEKMKKDWAKKGVVFSVTSTKLIKNK